MPFRALDCGLQKNDSRKNGAQQMEYGNNIRLMVGKYWNKWKLKGVDFLSKPQNRQRQNMLNNPNNQIWNRKLFFPCRFVLRGNILWLWWFRGFSVVRIVFVDRRGIFLSQDWISQLLYLLVFRCSMDAIFLYRTLIAHISSSWDKWDFHESWRMVWNGEMIKKTHTHIPTAIIWCWAFYSSLIYLLSSSVIGQY